MTPTDAEDDDAPSLWPALWAMPGAIVVYHAVMLAVMGSVPRAWEGGRQVVDWPWPLYGSLPTILAGLIGWVAIYLAVRSYPLRVALLIAFGLTLLVCSLLGINLLRRDYLGKF